MRSLVVVALFTLSASCCVPVFATTVEGLESDAQAAMQDGRYEAAQRLLEKVVEHRPGDRRALYNLACCSSRLGDVRSAEDHLQAAWAAGFRDLELVRTDPDLQALRDSRRGPRLIKKLETEVEQNRLLHGEPLLFDAQVLATSQVVVPRQMKPGKRLPLVVILHGHGGTADAIVGAFSAAGLSPPYVVLAPSGPYALHYPGRLGYSWYPPVGLYNEVLSGFRIEGGDQAEQRRLLDQREQETSEAYVLAAIDEVSRRHAIDSGAVVLIGHSEGGVLAYGLALSYPQRFHGLAVIGSRLREQVAGEERLARAAGQLRVLVCHSPEDEAIGIEHGKAAYRRLKEAGIDSRLLRYEGGHGLTAELIRELARWIDQVAAGR